MESWVLEGDIYSFHRSSPHTFSLPDRDGPNRVEIFDITNLPSQSSAISETTCLCDIFGDDFEITSLSRSPASATSLKKGMDALSSTDDNCSSGSYNTANNSEPHSDSSESFQDSKDSIPGTPAKDHFSSTTTDSSGSTWPNPEHENTTVNDVDPAFLTNAAILSNLGSSDLQINSEFKSRLNSPEQTGLMSMNVPQENYTLIPPNTSFTMSSPNISPVEPKLTMTKKSGERSKLQSPRESTPSPKLNNINNVPVLTILPEARESSIIFSSEPIDTRPLPAAKDFSPCTIIPESRQSFTVSSLEPEDKTPSPNIKGVCPVPAFSIIPESKTTTTSSPEMRGKTPSPELKDIFAVPMFNIIPESKQCSIEPLNELRGIKASPEIELLPVFSARSESRESSIVSSPKLMGNSPSPNIKETSSWQVLTSIAQEPSLTLKCEQIVRSTLPEWKDNIFLREAGDTPVVPASDQNRSLSTDAPLTEQSLTEFSRSHHLSSENRNEIMQAEELDCMNRGFGSVMDYSKDKDFSFEKKSDANPTESPGIVAALTPSMFTYTHFSPESMSAASPQPIDSLEIKNMNDSHPSLEDLLDLESLCSTSETSDNTSMSKYMTASHVSRSATSSPQIVGLMYSVNSPEASERTQSPEIRGITYSVLSHHTKSSTNSIDNTPEIEMSGSPELSCSNSTHSISNITPLQQPRNVTLSPDIKGTNLSHQLSSTTVEGKAYSSENISSDLSPVNSATSADSSGNDPSLVFFSRPSFESADKGHSHDAECCCVSGNKVSDTPSEVGCSDVLPEQRFLVSESKRNVSMSEHNQQTQLSGSLVETLCSNTNLRPDTTLTSDSKESSATLPSEGKQENGLYQSVKMETESAGNCRRSDQMPVKFREIPSVCHGDCSGDYYCCQCQNREQGADREGSVKQASETGEGKRDKGRAEQVELSVSARNRKWPAHHSLANTSTDLKSEIPACCYSESLLAARQQQTQSKTPKLQREKDKRHPRGLPFLYRRRNSAGHFSTGYTGEGSNMGSELDEADNEVKWLTDLAFQSLSSPQMDYLDIYNSSHRSSTNISQPSTEESTGANAWLSYADFHGSAQHESKDTSHQIYDIPTRDPTKHFEMGSFECVDVALESREDSNKGKRTVPKRQIHLKRFDAGCSKDALIQQHKTGPCEAGCMSDSDQALGTRQPLLLSETSNRTKNASCLIKNVLSKKMQNGSQITNKCKNASPTEVPYNPHEISSDATDMEHCTAEQTPHSIQPTLHLLDRDDLKQRKVGPKVPPKPTHYTLPCSPEYIPLRSDTKETDAPLEVRKNGKLCSRGKESQTVDSNIVERQRRDSAEIRGATQSVCMQRKLADTDQKINTQQSAKSLFMSKSSEITLKPCTKESQKESVKVSVSPDPETKGKNEIGLLEEKQANNSKPQLAEVEGTEDINGQNGRKPPMHKDGAHEAGVKVQRKSSPLQIECLAIRWKENKGCFNEENRVTLKTSDENVCQQSPENNRKKTTLDVTAKTISPVNVLMPGSQHKQLDAVARHITSVSVLDPNKVKKVAVKEAQQNKKSSLLIQQDSTTASPSLTPKSCSHSVSMILKEKGMQADIGLCDAGNENNSNSCTHVNRLEVPLPGCSVDGTAVESSQSTTLLHNNSLPICIPRPQEDVTVIFEENCNSEASTISTACSEKIHSPLILGQEQTEVIHVSSNAKGNKVPSKEIELPIQVRSISCDRSKPVIPTKPWIEIKSIVSEKPKSDTPAGKYKTDKRKSENVPTLNVNPLVGAEISQVVTAEDFTTPPERQISSLSHNSASVVSTDRQSHQSSPVAEFNDYISSVETKQQKQSTACGHELTTATPRDSKQPAVLTPNRMKQPVEPAPTQATCCVPQPAKNIPKNQVQTEASTHHFYTSDDPPSYDERESFGPYHLADLPPKRCNRYHVGPRHPHCSCGTSSHSYSNQSRQSPRMHTPPMAPQSPSQAFPFHFVPPQAQVRPHQCKVEGQPLNHQPGSPKTNHTPPIFHPFSQSPGCPAPSGQPSGSEQQHTPGQSLDRRPVHQLPQNLPVAGGRHYSEHIHPTSMPPMEPRNQYLCGPQDLASSFGPEYGNEGLGSGSVLYPESAGGLGYGQSPRRVLLDPETGKYFYIEVPMQPLRKMLFDPETGQYVEVVIPQQALSHSGLYPPSTGPYSSLHGPSLYASPYLPYSVPPHSQAPQPRHPEDPAPTTLHQGSMGFINQASQLPKPEMQEHPRLDQSYLESMYYIPTGMNASPHAPQSDCYSKPPNLPVSGGQRS
ncbi:uncharacterized protein LOC114767976 isoform X2 [Denticeps clupeoides]|uniref:uncharacterized protein LOC114767976 isoform X2 n=1 Tax=Denticeps clupeoides TaxID=299321 RepID=UPI0010A2BD75|nr:uncharacterized protein LOC114767976 isoform X2 [Denticeps clupeoides]